MSIYLKLDTVEAPAQIATNKGWGDTLNWISKLSTKDYPSLHHLATHGWEDDLSSVATQLEKAIRDHPPHSKDTMMVVRGLLSALHHRGNAQIAAINDGLTSKVTDE